MYLMFIFLYSIGDICKIGKDNSKNHICRQPENCTSLEQDIRSQNFPQVCSFIKNKPIVCCSPTIIVNITNYKPALNTTNASSSYSATESTYGSKFVY